MPVTAVTEARIAERAALLEAMFQTLAPYNTGNIPPVRMLAVVMQAIEDLSTAAGGGGTSAGTITTGVDASTNLAAVKTAIGSPTSSALEQSLRGDMIRILAELTNSKAISDLVVQDSSATPRYFIRQESVDQTTGNVTVTMLNLDGTVPGVAPTAPIIPYRSIPGNTVQEIYYTSTVAGTGYAINESIVFTRFFDAANALVTSNWYNVSQGTVIAAAPPIANLKGVEDELQEILFAINGKLATPAALSDAIANPTTQLNGGAMMGWNQAASFWERIRSGAAGVQTTIAGYLNTLPMLRYGLAKPTLANGNINNFQGDASGNLRVAIASQQGYPIAGGVAAAAVNAALIPVVDVSDFTNVQLAITGSFSGAFTIEQSPDPTFTAPVFATRGWSLATNSYVSSGTVNDLITIPVVAQFMRVRLSSYLSGSAFGFATGRTGPYTIPQDDVAMGIGAVTANTQRVTAAQVTGTRPGGGVNPLADTILPVNARIRQIFFTNNSATLLFLQIHSAAAPLTVASVPIFSFRIPANATLVEGIALLAESGTSFGSNVRIGISSTFGTYTAATAPTLATCCLNMETI
jgi:hypothetical protein